MENITTIFRILQFKSNGVHLYIVGYIKIKRCDHFNLTFHTFRGDIVMVAQTYLSLVLYLNMNWGVVSPSQEERTGRNWKRKLLVCFPS